MSVGSEIDIIWSDKVYEDYKAGIPKNALIGTSHEEKALYGRMPPIICAHMLPQGAREEEERLLSELENPDLSSDKITSIEEELKSPITKLGVAFYDMYGPQQTLKNVKDAFKIASSDISSDLSLNPTPPLGFIV
ncbi:MAG: hypothetical protein KAJ86_04650 [Alphaproteobacteria bacterium]|nr:hypothetical protein [Alphaproteobacteria bacterium]